MPDKSKDRTHDSYARDHGGKQKPRTDTPPAPDDPTVWLDKSGRNSTNADGSYRFSTAFWQATIERLRHPESAPRGSDGPPLPADDPAVLAQIADIEAAIAARGGK